MHFFRVTTRVALLGLTSLLSQGVTPSAWGAAPGNSLKNCAPPLEPFAKQLLVPDIPITDSPLPFEGANLILRSEPEIEARISFPEDSDQKTLFAATLESLNPELVEAAQAQLRGRHRVIAIPWTGSVYPVPLTSQFELAHSSGHTLAAGINEVIQKSWAVDGVPQDAEVSDLPNEPLMTLGPRLSPTFNKEGLTKPYEVRATHWIGRQSETAIYYDFASAGLQRQGWAVRLKIWSPSRSPVSTRDFVPDRSSLGGAVRMVITIKKSFSAAAPFTRRQEYSVRLPLDFDLSRVPFVVRAIFAQIAPDALPADQLVSPQYRVDTNRIVINLIEREGASRRKFGFMTVDSFFRLKFDGAFGIYIGAGTQMEFEVLPRFHREIFGSPASPTLRSLLGLLDAVRSSFRGQYDASPKYLTPNVHRYEGPGPD